MTAQKTNHSQHTIYLAGGCLWGVQEFIQYLPGVILTEAGRANGCNVKTQAGYDGYAECVRTVFSPEQVSIAELIEALFEIIDPYSFNQQGPDIGKKYRTGIYSHDGRHLDEATQYIQQRPDRDKVVVEVLPLTHYIASDAEHQHRLTLHPEDHHLCHIPWDLLHKYKGS